MLLRWPIYVLLVSPSPKFQIALLNDQPFLSSRSFSRKCTKWPRNDNEHYKFNTNPCVLFISKDTKFQFALSYDQPCLSYRPFWDKCSEWHQNEEPYRVKDSPLYMYYWYRLVANFSPFHSTASCFWVTGHFEKKCTKWLQNDLEPYKVKCTLYMLLVSTSHKFHSVSL